jgi:hypothetical protein
VPCHRYSELYIGITAACIPCLKAPLENIFRALGGHVSSALSKSQTGRPSLAADSELGYGLGGLQSKGLIGAKGEENSPNGNVDTPSHPSTGDSSTSISQESPVQTKYVESYQNSSADLALKSEALE